MSQSINTQVIVIGAGPGGYTAAFRAADLGKEVTLVDKNTELGGVCLNRGCIPSKTLLHIAKVIEEAKALSAKGVNFGTPELDMEKIRQWKDKVVGQLNRGIAQMAKARKVSTIHGTAYFSSNSSVVVESGDKTTEITFEQAIIATGSRSSALPGISTNHPNILNSTQALQLESVPERLLVVGGGYIGLEMGTVYNALGSKVSVVEFMDFLIPGADQDLVKPLERRLKRQFAEIMLSTKVVGMKPAGKEAVSVAFEDYNGKPQSRKYNKVLISVGRQPNSEHLKLEYTDIEVTDKGFIKVDKFQRTSVSNIYAIGDVAGDPMLAHKATHEGKVAAEVIAGLPAAFDARAIPAVIFTDPEIAWAGLTEITAKEKGIPYEKGEFPWAASGRSLSMGRNEGRTKILFDPETKRTLGIGIVGPGAGDLISEGVLAIEMGADADDIGLSIHPHPTLSETVANAAEVFSGTVTDLYIPKKQ